MKLELDNRIGAASFIGLGGFISTLVMIGIAWGSMSGKIDAAATKADAAKVAVDGVAKISESRDKRVNDQAVDISAIKTSIGFIVPTLARIEAKLDAAK